METSSPGRGERGVVHEEDHPLKAEVAVTVNITFRGGVYRDIGLHRARDYRLEDIGKNNGKEPANGN